MNIRSIAIITAVVLVLAVGGYGLYWYLNSQTSEETTEPVEAETDQEQAENQPQLSLEERFVQAFYDVELPNLEQLEQASPITGNQEADERIRSIAEQRGYRLQSIPTVELVVHQGVLMQEPVVEAWNQLQTAAIEEGFYLGLVSGYRSPDNQREIFINQLRERGNEEIKAHYSNSQIAAGAADAAINDILREYSIPGYSKHHNGYTIDITDTTDEYPFFEFDQAESYSWVSENDYANIRQFGFLPSYPEGGPSQGPNPEPWEYVWVGADIAMNL
ncbi:MAG: D-alanyl-D-alanine carboxypeptidase family protein [Candidatus Saccharimonadales bacterium]